MTPEEIQAELEEHVYQRERERLLPLYGRFTEDGEARLRAIARYIVEWA